MLEVGGGHGVVAVALHVEVGLIDEGGVGGLRDGALAPQPPDLMKYRGFGTGRRSRMSVGRDGRLPVGGHGGGEDKRPGRQVRFRARGWWSQRTLSEAEHVPLASR